MRKREVKQQHSTWLRPSGLLLDLLLLQDKAWFHQHPVTVHWSGSALLTMKHNICLLNRQLQTHFWYYVIQLFRWYFVALQKTTAVYGWQDKSTYKLTIDQPTWQLSNWPIIGTEIDWPTITCTQTIRHTYTWTNGGSTQRQTKSVKQSDTYPDKQKRTQTQTPTHPERHKHTDSQTIRGGMHIAGID